MFVYYVLCQNRLYVENSDHVLCTFRFVHLVIFSKYLNSVVSFAPHTLSLCFSLSTKPHPDNVSSVEIPTKKLFQQPFNELQSKRLFAIAIENFVI